MKDDNRNYKPDAKSRTAWELATHLAHADIWFMDSVLKGAFVWNPDAVKHFNWPAVRYIGFANNHSMHHRGQLAAYLRAMGSRVPNIYGPSADAKG